MCVCVCACVCARRGACLTLVLFCRQCSEPQPHKAYTFDNGKNRSSNVYYALNAALRNQKQDPDAFEVWTGYLYFLLRALRKLPKYEGLVYRGGNKGLDQVGRWG